MADKNIKKAYVYPKDFPALTNVGGTGKYLFRYRVASQEGGTYSSWSPKYSLASGNILNIVGKTNITSEVTSTGDTINVSWNVPKDITTNTFDVYIKWGTPDTTKTVTAASSDTGTGTVTITVSSHGYVAGEYVAVYGINSNIDGVHLITEVATNTFTYKKTTTTTYALSGLSAKAAKVIFANDTNGTYQYYSTTISNNYFTDIPTTFKSISSVSSTSIVTKFVFAQVQIETVTKELFDDAKLFEIGGATYPTPVDGGNIV